MLRSARLQALLVAAVVLAVLSPSLRAGFVWDDARTVLNAPVMSDPGNIPGFFVANIKSGLAESDGITEGFDLYRPMFLTALVLGYAAFDGPSPAGFHALCLLFHLAATLLVFVLARRWIPDGRDGPLPLLAALAFGLHPVTAEAYLFVAALAEPMAAAGLLLAVLCLDVAARREADAGTGALVAASFLAMLFGLFSKESPLLLLPVLSVFLVAARGLHPKHLIPAWVAAGIFLTMRAAAVGGLGATGNDADQRLQSLERLPLLLMDGLRASITLTPRGLRHLGYEWADVSTGVVLACAAGVVAVTVGAVLVRRRAPLVTLFVFALGSALLPVAMVTTVPDWGGFGRYLYAPWAIGAMALTAGLGAALTALDRERPGALRVGGAAIVALYALLTLVGIRESLHDWSSPAALAESGIRHAPDVGVHYAWLADARAAQGRLADAEALYVAAIERTPEYDPAWNHLAAVQLRAGRCEAALSTLDTKEATNAPGPKSTLLRLLCLIELERYDDAAARVLWALDRAPTHPDFLRLQGELLELHPDPAYPERLGAALDRGDAGAAEPAVRALLAASTGSPAGPSPAGR